MSSFPTRPSFWVGALCLVMALACGSDDEPPEYEVEETKFLDWNVTVELSAGAGSWIFGHGVLTEDETFFIVTLGPQVQVYDVTRPGDLVLWATFEDLDMNLYRADARGDQLWLRNNGVELYDISELGDTGPVLLQEHDLGDQIFDIEVHGDHVYVLHYDNLHIFERELLETQPATLDDAIGHMALPGMGLDGSLHLQSDEWLWISGYEGKALIDVGDKTAPTYARTLGQPRNTSIQIIGDHLVSHGYTWDISDPMNPEYVTFLPESYAYHCNLGEDTLISVGEGLTWADFSVEMPVEVRFIPVGGQFSTHCTDNAIIGQQSNWLYKIEQL